MNWIQRFLTAIATHKDDLDAHTRNIYAELRTGMYFAPLPVWGSSNARSLLGNRLYAFPFPIPRDVTIDRLAIQITATFPGKKARIGIYKNGTNIYPGDLLLDAGEVDAGTTGVKTVVINQALTKGLYWLSVVSDGSPALRALYSLFGPTGVEPSALGDLKIYWLAVLTYGTLPNPYPAGGTTLALNEKSWHLIFARLKSLD